MPAPESDTVAIVNVCANCFTASVVPICGVLTAYVAYRMAVLASRVKATAAKVDQVGVDVAVIKRATDGMHDKLVAQAELKGHDDAARIADRGKGGRPEDSQLS